MCPDLTGYSGPAQLEISLPTGYSLNLKLNDAVSDSLVTGIQESNDKTIISYRHVSLSCFKLDTYQILFFLQLTSTPSCLGLPLQLHYNVSNIFSILHARILSSLSPEHFHDSVISLPRLKAPGCHLCDYHPETTAASNTHQPKLILVALIISVSFCNFS